MSKRRLIVSPQAQRDIATLLRHSVSLFGAAAARRYHALLTQAQSDLLADPQRAGVTSYNRAPETFLFHARNSKGRAQGRVGSPRHILVFRLAPDKLEIVRVLHDAMDIEAHLEGGGDDE